MGSPVVAGKAAPAPIFLMNGEDMGGSLKGSWRSRMSSDSRAVLHCLRIRTSFTCELSGTVSSLMMIARQ